MPDAEPCKHDLEYAALPLLWHWPRFAGTSCPDCEHEAYVAWVESVRARLTAGLEAAAAGEPFEWEAPDPADDVPRFALVRLDDRLDLALTVDDGRCAVPAAGWYDFGRVTTLQEAVDAERHERAMRRVRDGVMTLEQARRTYMQVALG